MRSCLSESAFQEFRQAGCVRPGIRLPEATLNQIRRHYDAVPAGQSNWHCFLIHQILDRGPGLRGRLRRLFSRVDRRWTHWIGPRLAYWLGPDWSRKLYTKSLYSSSELLTLVLGHCLACGLADHLSGIPFLVGHELYLESNPSTKTFGDLNQVHHDGFVWDMFYQTGDDLSLYIPLHDLNEETGGRLMVEPNPVASSLYPSRNSRLVEFADFCRDLGVPQQDGQITREAILNSPHRRQIGEEYHAMEARLARLPAPGREELLPLSAQAGEVVMFNNKLFHDVEPWHRTDSRAIYVIRLIPLYRVGLAPPTVFLNNIPCNRLRLDSARGRIEATKGRIEDFFAPPSD